MSHVLRALPALTGICNTEGDPSMISRTHVEKFPAVELQELRDGLLQNGLDSWQAAELVSSFLAGRGYGVSRQSARDAVIRFEGSGRSIDGIQAELEKLAMVM